MKKIVFVLAGLFAVVTVGCTDVEKKLETGKEGVQKAKEVKQQVDKGVQDIEKTRKDLMEQETKKVEEAEQGK